MTTTAYGGDELRMASVRPVHLASRRLRVVGGSGRLRWWRGRLVLGFTLAGAMIGALYGVVQTYLAEGIAPMEALEAYGAGAGLGTSIGLVVGLLLAVVLGLADRYLLPQAVAPRPLWVRYRRDR
jgi:MFS family permease